MDFEKLKNFTFVKPIFSQCFWKTLKDLNQTHPAVAFQFCFIHIIWVCVYTQLCFLSFFLLPSWFSVRSKPHAIRFFLYYHICLQVKFSSTLVFILKIQHTKAIKKYRNWFSLTWHYIKSLPCLYEPLNVVAKQFPHVSKARETEILNLTHQSQIQHVITCLTLITYKHCPIKSNLEGVHLCFLK